DLGAGANRRDKSRKRDRIERDCNDNFAHDDRRNQVEAVADAKGSLLNLFDAVSGDGSTPSSIMGCDESIQAVKLAIAKLPEDYREIVELRYVQEKSVHETAEITGKSPDAIQGVCRRAKQKMLKTLGNASLYFSRSG
ncbi:MAG: sigma-70 family RNA polymerase sigma factor, partial [Chloroflexi bacterium]|nr:sigma-70 family RNA polymerase sigma factor [Chloroflexota bacterium]